MVYESSNTLSSMFENAGAPPLKKIKQAAVDYHHGSVRDLEMSDMVRQVVE